MCRLLHTEIKDILTPLKSGVTLLFYCMNVVHCWVSLQWMADRKDCRRRRQLRSTPVLHGGRGYTHAGQWLSFHSKVKINYVIILTNSMNLSQKVESAMDRFDWNAPVRCKDYCGSAALATQGSEGFKVADRLPSTADITSSLSFARQKRLGGLENFLNIASSSSSSSAFH